MKKKPNILFILIFVTLTSVAATIIIFLILSANSKQAYAEKLNTAAQYMEELKYEQAVAELELAIEIDPKEAAAYLELAKVYVAMEDYAAALEVLNEGIRNTEDESLTQYKTEVENLIEEIKRAEEQAMAEANAALEGDDPAGAPVVIERIAVRTERVELYDGMYSIQELDADDFVLKETYYSANDELFYTAFYEYDALGHKIKETDEYPDGTIWFCEITYTENTQFYNYNNYASDLLEYDDLGRIIKQTFTFNDGRVVTNEHLYDGNGNCTINYYDSTGAHCYTETLSEEDGASIVVSSASFWQ